MNFYAEEKIKEFDSELKSRIHYAELPAARRRPVIAGVVAATGALLRRTGERLESLSGQPADDSPVAHRSVRFKTRSPSRSP